MDNSVPEIWLELDPPLILLVQPDEGLRRKMEEELSEYEVLTAENGGAALQLSRTELPDAIVASAGMPGGGGLEFCRQVRADPALGKIPVALLAPPDPVGFEDVIGAGAAEVIAEPCGAAELRLRVGNMVRTQLYRRELERKNHVIIEALNDLKAAETMLIHAEKLSMLGEMSAGIVHEINNPMNYAKSALFMLDRHVKGMAAGETRDELVELVGDATDGIDRIGRIIHDLRTFATKGGVEVTAVDLAEVVRIAARLIGDRLSNLRYVEELSGPLLVRGNENGLCQVVLNLIKNGVEATEAAGRPVAEAEIRVVGEETANGVVLRVRDNGCGISPVEQASLFEPFFTTKERGRGMGLGLSISRRILSDHGATIEVESVEGQWTEFILRFVSESDDDGAGEGEPEALRSETRKSMIHTATGELNANH